jgi:hypothetical protein
MGLLSSLFGGSKSSSAQQQTSDSQGFGLNRSNASSSSGATSSGMSAGISGSRGTSGSTSSVFASDLVRQLFSGATDAASAINPTLATERNNQLFTGGASIIEKLSGGGAGEDYLNRRLEGDGGAVLNGQIDAIGSDLGRFFNEQLNPAITGSAVAGGALGGGRQGVAQAGAMDSVLREFATQAGNLRAADITSRDNAALGLLSSQNERADTALGSLSGLSDLGSGLEALSPYAALSQIIGGPTVLQDSFGETSSFGQEMSQQQSEEFATSLAEELGISYDEAHSLLTSTSKGKSSNGIIPGLASLGGLFGG